MVNGTGNCMEKFNVRNQAPEQGWAAGEPKPKPHWAPRPQYRPGDRISGVFFNLCKVCEGQTGLASFRYAAMKFKGIGWVGYRARNYQPVVKIFQKVLQMDTAEAGEDYTLIRFSGGDELEIMKVSGEDHVTGAGRSATVPGFVVDSISEGISRIRDVGLSITSPVQYGNDGSCWVHFQLPDGSEWELK